MSHNTIVHRLVRPPVRLLARTGVTPNQLTTLRLATGLLAAAGFAAGGRTWPAWGAACMLASLLLDRADGELARSIGKTSKGGTRYDLWADAASTVAVFIGMGWGSRAAWGPAAALYGVIAAVSVVVLFLLMQRLEPAGGVQSARPFDPDDALLATPLFVWTGLMPWAVLIAAVISPLTALGLGGLALVQHRRFASRG